MKKILVISNTAFSIEKFRLHYLSLATKYTFEVYTPNIKVINYKKLKNINTFSFNNLSLLGEAFFLFNLIFFNVFNILVEVFGKLYGFFKLFTNLL